jgi:formate hydrogenlyase transcriptional activator
VADAQLLTGSFSRDSGAVARTTDVVVDGFIGRTRAFRDVLDRLTRVAPTDSTVLITGETGTGKGVLARAIHRLSRRAARPMVTAQLAAIPEALIASELFGHEAGAFTGASHRRVGRFELADRGTLFLDEVGELPAEMQVALLRVLQDGEFERVGASQTRVVDVRVIAATNRNLGDAIKQKELRQDLFFRLNVFPIHMPALRERRDDISALAYEFVRQSERRLGRRFGAIDQMSLDRLIAFDWPGNIRQLQSVIEHSAILCDDGPLQISPRLLDDSSIECHAESPASNVESPLLANERRLIEDALRATRGRVSGRSGAAERLGLPASTLESKIKRLQIDKAGYKAI